MAENLEIEGAVSGSEPEVVADDVRANEPLRTSGEQLATKLGWLPGTTSSAVFAERSRKVRAALRPILAAADAKFAQTPASDDLRWLRDNSSLVYAQTVTLIPEVKTLRKLPHVRARNGEVAPRALALPEAYLKAVDYVFTDKTFSSFCQGFEDHTPLNLRELWALVPGLKLALLEEIANRARAAINNPAGETQRLGICISSLRDVTQSPWKEILEPLIAFDPILRSDPSGAYAAMEFESRNLYRDELARIAACSDFSEVEVARDAIALAQHAHKRPYQDQRIATRESHVGYYIVGEGADLLRQKVGCKPHLLQRLRHLMLRHPDEVFLPGVAILTFAIITEFLLWLTPPDVSPELMLLSMLILLLPSSQSAVQVMNYLITALLPAKILPKLDFSEGIPAEFTALVAVPTLLLNEKQVRGLIENLEVRYLGNHDPNVHFALVSDLPDSDQPSPEENPLIDLCANLIRELNEKYGAQNSGTFFLLHRHRVYNPREKGWMGWERKRGKLMDLNKLLRGQYDSFPVKVGDLSLLPNVRYVITLDSDTELPRGSAYRMIGTMAHPLNQAIIDPNRNVVVAGYGILQPRVGVSVQSTSRSRLAAVYAGETGFDIYTRAVSDAYQDLYGEGSFTGKGIYDVDAFLGVLDRRFPRNALLSHDLIEGAYVRSGLASDIEVIEDYPSHYSAYNRRKHRWLRGDWQIVEWLTSRVPDESGARVANPISLVARWKILDNLRRSLVEPAIFIALLFGWLIPTGRPIRWTIATLAILFIPVIFQLIFGLVKAAIEQNSTVARETVSGFYASCFNVLLTIVFLAHQMLLSLDAVVRALVRRMVTRERLLEWETAEEAEIGEKRTPVDRYLDWMPVLAAAVAVLVWAVRPLSLWAAAPILFLWACSKIVSRWLNQSPIEAAKALAPRDAQFLRKSALHIWRYFSEFSTPEHHWLVPDNVQEEPAAIAARVSPTNLGLLLNARQVACELGYLTVPEMLQLTRNTLDTLAGIPKHKGHLLNWYDSRTLEPLSPRFISSVDNGNLLASLWTLQQGFLDRVRQPLLQTSLAAGLLDFLRLLAEKKALSKKDFSRYESELRGASWLIALLALPESLLNGAPVASKAKQDANSLWFHNELRGRVASVQALVRAYAPWWLPEFEPLRSDPAYSSRFAQEVSLELLPAFIDTLREQLRDLAPGNITGEASLPTKLLEMLPETRTNAVHLIEDLKATAAEAGKLGDDMDFAFLLDPRRKLMSVGFNVDANELQASCYDLLATESRTAVFISIAKEDIPQESWFNLGRPHTVDQGQLVLLSWTGTMFEYLMPFLWLRSYTNTLLDRSRIAAVRSQQAYGNNRGIPWGISESSYYKLDDAGNYQYQAFGLPQLAMMKSDTSPVVVSPYSTFLALSVDPDGALKNLRRMESMGWFGSYGFYESADYSAVRSRFRISRCQIVRLWMAHHHGMSLLSITNFLCDNVVQRWFHSDRRVQATELLLHEKPVSHVRASEIPRSRSAA
ncbi:MAG TPA: glucoamylase family protein [Candidatus Sulfotelmatobacter sp.]